MSSKRLFVVVAVLILFTFLISVNASDKSGHKQKDTETCHEIPRNNIEKYLSTKTPYRVVANLNDKPLKYEGKQQLSINACYSLFN